MAPPDWPPDVRKRLRAARGYAGMSLDDLAAKTGLGRQTIFRMESGERGGERIKEMELREIARVCGLPFGFFTEDWGRLEQLPPSLGERLSSIERQLGPDYTGLDEAARGLGGLTPPNDSPADESGDTPQPGATQAPADQSPQ